MVRARPAPLGPPVPLDLPQQTCRGWYSTAAPSRGAAADCAASCSSFCSWSFWAASATEPGDRYHEVPPGKADQPLDTTLVIALAGAAITVLEQVMRLQGAEQPCPLACAVRQDLRHQAAVVVVENRQRNAPKEPEGMDMSIRPRLRRRRRVGPDETGVAVRQVHHKEMGLLLDALSTPDAFAAEVVDPKALRRDPGPFRLAPLLPSHWPL